MSDTPVPSNRILLNNYGPVTAGQLFDRTFALLRERPKLFFGIALVMLAVELGVFAVMGISSATLRSLHGGQAYLATAFILAPLALLGGAFVYVISQLVYGALFFATDALIRRDNLTIGDACNLALARVGSLIGVAVLIALRVIGLALLVFIPVVLLLAVLAATVAGIGAHGLLQSGHISISGIGIASASIGLLFGLGCAALFFWFLARYAIAVPACLAENLTAAEAIRRSVALSAKSKGRIYAVFAVIAGASIAIAVLITPLQLMASYAGQVRHTISPMAGTTLANAFSGVQAVLGMLLTAFSGVAITLCYFDLRVRKEGFGMTAAVVEHPHVDIAQASGILPGDMPIS